MATGRGVLSLALVAADLEQSMPFPTVAVNGRHSYLTAAVATTDNRRHQLEKTRSIPTAPVRS